MNAIVITFDRLPLGFLGCCGNGWIETPNFDRLAAQSVLFQQHFAGIPTVLGASGAWWSGRYHRCGIADAGRRGNHPSSAAEVFLPKLCADGGVTFRLLTETDSDNISPPEAQLVPELIDTVSGRDGLDVPPEETPVFRLVARAQRDLRLLRTSRAEPWLLWIHSRGVPVPWLAPREFAARFLDIADDETSEHEPGDLGDDEPCGEFDEVVSDEEEESGLVELSAAEFDELLQAAARLPESRALRNAMSELDRGLARKVLGGYVALLDAALGRLLEQIDQTMAAAPTLLVATAARGIVVREPGLMRDEWEALAEETVHVPLFIRPAGMIHGSRRQTLVQPVDLLPTLAEWFGIDVTGMSLDGQSLLPVIRGEKEELRPHSLIGDGRPLAGIRTADFYLVSKGLGDSAQDRDDSGRLRLFAKPEDVWETNDLAAQFPQVVDDLSSQLERFIADEGSTKRAPT